MANAAVRNKKPVLVLGSFVADVSFRLPRLPEWGETLMGSSFELGPGGKGSNQAVAAARAGAAVRMLTKLGADAFGEQAREVWADAGVDASLVLTAKVPTGAAAILVQEEDGRNAIAVVPGACAALTPDEVESVAGAIREAAVLLVQLEVPVPVVEGGLRLARAAGVTTILNPAPALEELPDALLALADFVIPNETEAAVLTRCAVERTDEAPRAARTLQARGARHVVLTLGERGSLVCLEGDAPISVEAFAAGPCIDTTGAGDAFCGAFAAALAEGQSPREAARFASAAAGLSVTRRGTARSMPSREEIESLLASGGNLK